MIRPVPDWASGRPGQRGIGSRVAMRSSGTRRTPAGRAARRRIWSLRWWASQPRHHDTTSGGTRGVTSVLTSPLGRVPSTTWATASAVARRASRASAPTLRRWVPVPARRAAASAPSAGHRAAARSTRSPRRWMWGMPRTPQTDVHRRPSSRSTSSTAPTRAAAEWAAEPDGVSWIPRSATSRSVGSSVPRSRPWACTRWATTWARSTSTLSSALIGAPASTATPGRRGPPRRIRRHRGRPGPRCHRWW